MSEKKHPDCPKCGANDWDWIPREPGLMFRLMACVDGQHTYAGCRQCGTPYPSQKPAETPESDQ